MEKQQALETESSYTSTTEPHFDEEWTLLSARQVVPLKELNSRSHRPLKLVAAFLVASMLGAVVALIAIRLREIRASKPDDAAALTQQNEATQSQVVESSTTQGETAVASTDNTDTSSVVRSKTPVSLIERAKNQSPHKAKLESNNAAEQPDSLESDTRVQSVQESSDPRPRLVDEWQERRARRAIRRYHRERAASHRRDLRRIDEIFEGVRPE